MRRVLLGPLVVALVLTGSLIAPAESARSSEPTRADARGGTSRAATTAARVPALQVTRIATGLDIPWDVKSLGDGRLLITERTRARVLVWDRGVVRPIAFPSASVWASGETGLMGLAVDPAFRSNRRFYTCQGGFLSGGGHHVRVVAWRLNAASTGASYVRTLVGGLPATTGRHGGCRLLIASNGAMIVGTGDAAVGTNPRDLRSLGGKTLRLNRFTGAPWPGNPFLRSRSRAARLVLTFGHRNVQGLVQRPDGTLWSVEHGSSRDDEVNRLRTGGDYGWNPVPGYDESVPMTDQRLPGTQIYPRWRSGYPTIATSGAAWVVGRQWGGNNGTLAVAALKGERLLFMRFDSIGRLRYVRTPAALRAYGRLRSVTRLGNGDLLVTTSNGGGADVILRVRPSTAG